MLHSKYLIGAGCFVAAIAVGAVASLIYGRTSGEWDEWRGLARWWDERKAARSSRGGSRVDGRAGDVGRSAGAGEGQRKDSHGEAWDRSWHDDRHRVDPSRGRRH